MLFEDLDDDCTVELTGLEMTITNAFWGGGRIPVARREQYRH